MFVANYDPVNGWSVPEIKPYERLSLDPTTSCLHYATSVFEGMKVRLLRSIPDNDEDENADCTTRRTGDPMASLAFSAPSKTCTG